MLYNALTRPVKESGLRSPDGSAIMVSRNASSRLHLHPVPTCQTCQADMVLATVKPCAERYDLWSYRCMGCSVTFQMVEPRAGHPAARIEQRAVARRRSGVAFD